MYQLTIVRLEESEEGTIGALLINGKVFCLTLEPDRFDDIRFQVPEGIYNCQRFHGTKYKDTFEIIVDDHVAILFHWGNIERDTKACVLLGKTVGELDGKRAVLSSRDAFNEFMITLKGVETFSLEIKRV